MTTDCCETTRCKMLPEPGLIVSCYMHSMKDCTKSLIDTIWEIDEVKTIRIEGIDNINHANKLKDIKHKYIIGLIKDKEKELAGLPYISASLDDIKRLCDYSGADMIAIDSRIIGKDGEESVADLYEQSDLPIMADIAEEIEADIAFNYGASIISTTFTGRAFELASNLSREDRMNVNIEGGLINYLDVQMAKSTGAKWWTVGRAIHDVKTTVRSFF